MIDWLILLKDILPGIVEEATEFFSLSSPSFPS
jgi:hypothetical protein